MNRADRRELKSIVQKRLDEIDRFVDSDKVQVKDDQMHIDPLDLKKARELYKEVAELKGLLDLASVGEKMQASYDLNPESESIALATHGAGGMGGEAKSLGEWFTQSAQFNELKQSGQLNMSQPWKAQAVDICRGGRFFEQKDVYATMNPATYTRQMGSIQFDPMVPRAYRQTRVRDLFPVATTSSNLIDFFQVMGYAASNQGAKSVPDRNVGNTAFAQKPHTNLVFRPNQAPVRTLAHWEAAHRNVLDDVPQLQSTINNELLYGLALEEDRQILNGSGNNDELLGILQADETQTYTGADEIRSDSIRRALTKSVLANYEPNGVVVHPIDFEYLELQKGIVGGTGGDGQYMVTSIQSGMEKRVWRQPLVETPAMPQGTFLTGAFGIGVQLYDRQLANVRTSEHHAEMFTSNGVVILVEERLAMAIKRPESLTIGTFAVADSP